MTIVWAVACYDYEDSCTPAIFATRELAEAHAAELNASSSNDYDVEPYPIMEEAARKVTWYQAGFYRDGQTITRPIEDWNYAYLSDPYVSEPDPLGNLYRMAWGTDREATEAALKAAVDATGS